MLLSVCVADPMFAKRHAKNLQSWYSLFPDIDSSISCHLKLHDSRSFYWTSVIFIEVYDTFKDFPLSTIHPLLVEFESKRHSDLSYFFWLSNLYYPPITVLSCLSSLSILSRDKSTNDCLPPVKMSSYVWTPHSRQCIMWQACTIVTKAKSKL